MTERISYSPPFLEDSHSCSGNESNWDRHDSRPVLPHIFPTFWYFDEDSLNLIHLCHVMTPQKLIFNFHNFIAVKKFWNFPLKIEIFLNFVGFVPRWSETLFLYLNVFRCIRSSLFVIKPKRMHEFVLHCSTW